jgi:hypothetical protein
MVPAPNRTSITLAIPLGAWHTGCQHAALPETLRDLTRLVPGCGELGISERASRPRRVGHVALTPSRVNPNRAFLRMTDAKVVECGDLRLMR